jgi:diguanylate cyclase (GGDEF)-like protein
LQNSIDISPQDTRQLMVDAFWPLHRSVLIALIPYYIYVTVSHSLDETGWHLLMLGGCSALTAAAAMGVLALRMTGRMTRADAVEIAMAIVSLAVLMNVVLYHVAHFTPAKLIYFPLVAVTAAMASASTRAVLVLVALTVGAMIGLVAWYERTALGGYISIGVATMVTTVGFTAFLSGVVMREVAARLKADAALTTALEAAADTARLARLDPLTALPNRRGFFEMIEERLPGRGNDPDADPGFSLGLCDLDGFKAVNDGFGHGMGDRVLREVAARLSRAMTLPVRPARLGGDEFGLLVPGQHSDRELDALGRELARSLQQPFAFDGATLRLSGSMGFTRARAGDTIATVLDRADYVAYVAKHKHRGATILFGVAHEEAIREERQLERIVLGSNLEACIYPVFQPIVEGATGRLVSYEALARWRGEDGTELMPTAFIPMAERLALAPRITQIMTRKVLDVVPHLPPGVRVSVNLSAQDLASPQAIAALCELLADGRNRPMRIDFEITETAVMGEISEASDALVKLLARGARIALDDFGTGHSSLSRVHRLPLQRIKVDRSFVSGVGMEHSSDAIVRTTLDLCRNLGLSCVLEGVETEAQRQALLAMGGQLFQGYLFSRPLPTDAVLAAAGMRASA